MATKRPEPTFIVRFVGEGIAPEMVPWRAVNEAISAAQDLASGRDPLEKRPVPADKSIRLLNVRRGSAQYSCISRDPAGARKNLRFVGKVLSSDGEDTAHESELAKAISPIKRLSDVAKSMDCRLEIALAAKAHDPLFIIQQDAYTKLTQRLFLTGETTIIGTVKRVGGQTDMKCAMTIPGRRHLLYCSVQSDNTRETIRQLGKQLYEQVAAHGTAVWIHRTWYIYKFTIHSFTQPRMGNVNKLITKLRDAGLNAWDKVADPDAIIEESRS
jgi:hypothetical protein